MKQLIMRVFYICVAGMSRQQASEYMYELTHDRKELPDDIKENYHIEDVWIAVTTETKVEIIFPTQIDKNIENLDLDSLDKLTETIDKFKEIKLKQKEFLKMKMLEVDPYGEEDWGEN